MTISSVQSDYLTTLSNTITLDTSTLANVSAASGGLDTITISSIGGNYYNTGAGVSGGAGNFTIANGGAGTIGPISNLTISGLDASTFNWKNEEFVDCLPDFNRVQAMCEQYPSLKIAYEKFVTTYKLVKDHYDTPEDQRPRP